MLSVQIQNQKIESDQKISNCEKDIDEFVETMQNEINALKANLVQSLNKKADYSMLDRLNEVQAKKVDQEQVRTLNLQMKQEIMQQLDIVRSDINLERASREQKIQEKLEKNEVGCEKALDEINAHKE